MSVLDFQGEKLSGNNSVRNTTGIFSCQGKTPVFLWVLLGLLGLDLLTRSLCFSGACRYAVFPGFGFMQFRNYDFAFSIKLPIQVIYTLYIGVLSVLVHQIFRKWSTNRPRINFAWLLVCVGAAANIFDRLYFGYVRDFIRLGNGYFNLGDVWIVSGIIFICWYSLDEART